MAKYWGKQIFAHGSFPEVGQKTEKKEKKKRYSRDLGLVQVTATFLLRS